MQDFPQKTFFNKPIPKAKFYEKLPVTQAVKNCFVNEISGIVWRNKLSAETLNVQPGSRVQELEVIEITLKGESLNDSVLKLIDKGIPYQLLFLLKRGEEYQLCMGYKETETSAVKEYFKTAWMTFEALPLQITGLTLDEVCDNFIRQINTRLAVTDAIPLKEALADDALRQKIEKQIALLEKKMKAEKQPKRKFELHEEIQRLKNHEIHESHEKDF